MLRCRKLQGLRCLELCSGEITDAGVRQLLELRGLTALSLAHNARIGDVSGAALASLTALRQLNLAQSGVSGKGIQPLARIPVRVWRMGA